MKAVHQPKRRPTRDEMLEHAVHRPNGGIGPHAGSSDLSDTVRRRAYLVVSCFLVAVVARRLLINGFGSPYGGIAYPICVVLLAAMFVGVWRRRLSLWGFEVALLGMVVTVLLGFLATWRVAPAYLAAEPMDIFLVMLWSGLAFPLAFLVLGTRHGLRASLAFYAAIVLLIVPPIIAGIPGGAQPDPTTTFVSLVIFFAVMILLLWVLASRLEELAVARAAASLFASQAGTDALTGLPNRRQLLDQLDRDIARAHRHRESLSVLLVDLDRFKSVNDRYGHEAGDRALSELGSWLTGTVRAGDLAGRWGGEEFLVIAPNTGQDAALALAERCRAVIADQLVKGVGKLTASFGVATLREGEDALSVVHRADAALYAAKDGGRDAVAGTRGLVA